MERPRLRRSCRLLGTVRIPPVPALALVALWRPETVRVCAAGTGAGSGGALASPSSILRAAFERRITAGALALSSAILRATCERFISDAWTGSTARPPPVLVCTVGALRPARFRGSAALAGVAAAVL